MEQKALWSQKTTIGLQLIDKVNLKERRKQMKLTIRQLKTLIKEQIEESGEDRDDWADERINADRQGQEPPSPRRTGRPAFTMEDLVELEDKFSSLDVQTDNEGQFIIYTGIYESGYNDQED